ncbi:hypothetical protein OPV22_020033 [Ensete ventricosum]|uniref:Uncharacterized protein n=1 Tax=Ensete ventricosum TaxID=4639 RepID=A0AAV8QD85_ENSVE|nr:hypothetical protein OPV22_020033 [Ensete ventricosum]
MKRQVKAKARGSANGSRREAEESKPRKARRGPVEVVRVIRDGRLRRLIRLLSVTQTQEGKLLRLRSVLSSPDLMYEKLCEARGKQDGTLSTGERKEQNLGEALLWASCNGLKRAPAPDPRRQESTSQWSLLIPDLEFAFFLCITFSAVDDKDAMVWFSWQKGQNDSSETNS